MKTLDKKDYWRLWSRRADKKTGVSGWAPWETVFPSHAAGVAAVASVQWASLRRGHEWVLLPVGVVPAAGIPDLDRGVLEESKPDGTIVQIVLW